MAMSSLQTQDLRFNLNLAQAHLKLRDFGKAIDSKLQTASAAELEDFFVRDTGNNQAM